jgi:hypothetical protein
MTFVHATTLSPCPLELFAHWAAWRAALVKSCRAACGALQLATVTTARRIAALAERAVPRTASDRFLATAELHGWHQARGIDGTHNFRELLQ